MVKSRCCKNPKLDTFLVTNPCVSLGNPIWLDHVIGLALLRRRTTYFRDSSSYRSASSAEQQSRRKKSSAIDAENRRSSAELASFLPFVSISEAGYEIDWPHGEKWQQAIARTLSIVPVIIFDLLSPWL